jgi:hypothetical protein
MPMEVNLDDDGESLKTKVDQILKSTIIRLNGKGTLM